MSPEEKKLEKLNKLFELVNEDYATPDDLIKFTEGILGIINAEKKQLQALVTETGSKADTQSQAALAKLASQEEKLLNFISGVEQTAKNALSQATESLKSDIKRVEKKIPTKTDLSDLYREIADIKESFNTLPTELTMNNEAIRDGLELLVGDERLDREAIRGLEDYEDIKKKANEKVTGPGSPAGALKEMYGWRNGSTTTFNKITVSATAPVDPKLHDLWFDIS